MDKQTINLSGTQSSTSNPFCAENGSDQANYRNTSFKDVGGPSLAAFSGDDFLPRESLGILPDTMLIRDSLSSDFFSESCKDTSMISPRESLGILNISSMDFGRESMAIFNVNSSVFGREFIHNDGKENSLLIDFQDLMPLDQANPIPQLLLTNTEEEMGLTRADFNKAFLFPKFRKISGVSSGSSGVSFNPRSFEEPSKIHLFNSVIEHGQGTTNPLNEAFRWSFSTNPQSSTHFSFARDLENIRNRIQSLPLAFEPTHVLGHISLDNKTANVNFDEEIICRGVDGEKDLNDSVFLQDKIHIDGDASFKSIVLEKSFDEVRYLLDSTPQPEWEEWDSSKSNVEDREKSPTYCKEGISKKVDKMLGMQPVNLDEKLKLKNNSKCDSTSSVNISQNISKMSRASQCSILEHQSCTSNNFSQDLSKISQNSEKNISGIITKLSDILNKKENLSKSQKNDGHHMLHALADLLTADNGDKTSEDSEHSSVEDPQVEEKQETVDSPELNNEKVCEALDLSCKTQLCSSTENKSLSRAKSPTIRNPPPYVVYSPNHAMLTNTSTDSAGQTGDTETKLLQANTSSHSNTSGKNCSSSSVISLRRRNSITQNKVSEGTEKIKRAKTGIVSSKKEPLRAILPVENMAKSSKISKSMHVIVTPERKNEANKMTFNSKKTSTPLQEVKLKPMAASTPTNQHPKDSIGSSISNAGKPKLTRSFSYQPRPSSASVHPTGGHKSGENNISKGTLRRSASKIEGTQFARRTENTLNRANTVEGSPLRKRSYSTGKEPKILTALSKVRQNILNSPYFNTRKSTEIGTKDGTTMAENNNKLGTDLKRCSVELKSLSKISQAKKIGKENLKP